MVFLGPFYPSSAKTPDANSSSVEPYEESFIVRPSILLNSLSLQLLKDGGYPPEISYQPNARISMGIEVLYKSLGIGASFKLPSTPKPETTHGSTETSDYRIYYYGRKLGAEFIYQDYRSFYSEIPNISPQSIRPDLRLFNTSFYGYYAFSIDDFSLASALRQIERQRKSSFAFVLGVNLSSFGFTANRSVLPDARDSEFGNYAGLSSAEYLNAFIMPGLGYNMQESHDIFFSFIGSLGTGITRKTINTTAGAETKFVDNFKVQARGSLGINTNRFMAGLIATIDMSTMETFSGSKVNVRMLTVVAELFAGIRF